MVSQISEVGCLVGSGEDFEDFNDFIKCCCLFISNSKILLSIESLSVLSNNSSYKKVTNPKKKRNLCHSTHPCVLCMRTARRDDQKRDFGAPVWQYACMYSLHAYRDA